MRFGWILEVCREVKVVQGMRGISLVLEVDVGWDWLEKMVNIIRDSSFSFGY
jgi:hypothetical protein